VAPLEDPVSVSEVLNVPEGTVIVIDVASGLVITEAVAELTLPVTVSPSVKLALLPTLSVIIPSGYSVTPETSVWVTSATVQRFSPLFAQSANSRLSDLLAVLAS
jgi:hypothetical protein